MGGICASEEFPALTPIADEVNAHPPQLS
jgi:hypothetical protein